MCHREARLRQNQQGSLFQALGRRRSNPLSYRASSPEVFLIPGRSKSFGHRPPSVLDVARSFRIARNRLWPRWQRARSQGVCLSSVNLLWLTSHFSVSSEPLPTPDDKSAHRQTVVGSSERRCYPIPSPRKFTSSRFTSSAWVQVMQCGPSFGVDQDFRFAILARLYIQPPLLEPFLSFFPSRATGRPVPPILVCGMWFSLLEQGPPTAFTARSRPLSERPRRQPIHWGLLAVPSNFAVVLKGSYFPVIDRKSTRL